MEKPNELNHDPAASDLTRATDHKLIENVMLSIEEAVTQLRNQNNELEAVAERVFGSAPEVDPSKEPPCDPGMFNIFKYHLGHLHEEIHRNQNAIERLTDAF